METPLLVIQAEYNRYNSSRCELFPDRVVLSTRCTGGRWPVYGDETREIPIADIERVEISVGGTGFFAHQPNAVHFITRGNDASLPRMYRYRRFRSAFYIYEGVQQFCAVSAADLAEKVSVAARMKAYIDESIRRAQVDRIVEQERRDAGDVRKWLRESPLWLPGMDWPLPGLEDDSAGQRADDARLIKEAFRDGRLMYPEAFRNVAPVPPRGDGAAGMPDGGDPVTAAGMPADDWVDSETVASKRVSADGEAVVQENISANGEATVPGDGEAASALAASASAGPSEEDQDGEAAAGKDGGDRKLTFRERVRLCWDWLLDRPALPLTLLLLALSYALRPDVRSAPVPYLIGLANLAAARLPIALGAAGCMIVAGPDLSGGRVMGLTAFFSAVLLQKADVAGRFLPGGEPLPVWAALLAVMTVGALIGLANGLAVGKGKGHPLVVTLAAQFIVYGAYLALSGSRQIASLDGGYTSGLLLIPAYRFGSAVLPMSTLFSVLAALVVSLLWNCTGLDDALRLVGSDREEAREEGHSAPLVIGLAFTLAGALYGLGGFLECARVGMSSPSLGLHYEFDALAAAVLGGVTLAGGRGTVLGVTLGTLPVAAVAEGLHFLGVTGVAAYAVQAGLVLLLCLLEALKYRGKQ